MHSSPYVVPVCALLACIVFYFFVHTLFLILAEFGQIWGLDFFRFTIFFTGFLMWIVPLFVPRFVLFCFGCMRGCNSAILFNFKFNLTAKRATKKAPMSFPALRFLCSCIPD